MPHSVYIVFIVIQCCSLGFALFLLPTKDLVRSDGTHIAVLEPPSVKESIKQTARLFTDWRIVLLIPAFFTPESELESSPVFPFSDLPPVVLTLDGAVFFPFQASMNAYAFNLRTRTLNSLLNNLIQIPTSLGMGLLVLDNKRLGSRRKRALIGIAIDAVWITAAYIAQTIWLSSWDFNRSVEGPMIDCTDDAYAGAVTIYMAYGRVVNLPQGSCRANSHSCTIRDISECCSLRLGHIDERSTKGGSHVGLVRWYLVQRHSNLLRSRRNITAVSERERSIFCARNTLLADSGIRRLQLHN